jgi:putative hydrolase of the HAD superfamily
MNDIKAVGFDLFNTLITVERHALDEAESRLIRSLRQSGLSLENDGFRHAHREAALRFIKETQKDGRETHNRFWISAALKRHGYSVPPEDPRIASAVNAYFSAFLQYCHRVPGTREMLSTLKATYRLGLLSNFTHAPAAMEIIDVVGLTSFFDVVLISGALGYRKPHPFVFRKLIEQLGVEKHEVLYVGDDPEPDITGAQRTGLKPVWATYVRDRNIPLTPGVMSRSSQKADPSVPRICSWKELLSLLGKG